MKQHNVNPGPRVGVAYQLGEKTVIRAGYSIFYSHAGGVGGRTNGRQGLSQLGFNNNGSLSSAVTGQPAYNWNSGYPGNPLNPPFFNPSFGIGFITAAAAASASVPRRPDHGPDHHLRRSQFRRQSAVLRGLEFQYPAFVHSELDVERGL